MDEVKEFDVDFVERTKEILGAYNGTRDMSIILNCLMGLVIFPFEKIKATNDSFWDTELSAITDFPIFKQHKFEPIEKIKNAKVTYYPKTLRTLLRKVRNGIVHTHIEAINDNGQFAAVGIRNYFEPKTKTYLDMHLEFSQEQLRVFALFIADEYLKHA